MNTIQNSMVQMTTDGQTLYRQNISKAVSSNNTSPQVVSQSLTPTGAQVAQSLAQSIAEVKADTQELQKMSELVSGNKLQFNVNKDLNTVVVSVIDASTNQVIKQIPSEDMIKLKLRIRNAIGSVFNEVR